MPLPTARFAGSRSEGRGLAIVRQGNAWYALRDVCPHIKARVCRTAGLGARRWRIAQGPRSSWDARGEILSCPWHGWEYDVRTGRSLCEPEKVRVRTYPARVEDGRVVVELG